MKSTDPFVVIGLTGLLAVSALAQQSGSSGSGQTQQSPMPQPTQQQMARPAERGSSGSVEGQYGRRRPGYASELERSAPRVFWKESQLTKKEKQVLAVAAEDQKTFAAFLAQPGTGLCKLLSAGGRTVSASAVKNESADLPIAGGGAFFSFTKLRHDADEWAQIKLQDGNFQIAFFTEQRVDLFENRTGAVVMRELYRTVFENGERLAVLTELGDVPLEQLKTDSPGLTLLHTFPPPVDPEHYLAQLKHLRDGITADGHVYKSSVPARLNTAYGLRAINYGRADVLIVFRVVRQDEDGSLHLLWKKLSDYPVLKLESRAKK
ncbi:MAG: hypothetical protein U0Z53_10665 [Blastocatellia bacterium]